MLTKIVEFLHVLLGFIQSLRTEADARARTDRAAAVRADPAASWLRKFGGKTGSPDSAPRPPDAGGDDQP